METMKLYHSYDALRLQIEKVYHFIEIFLKSHFSFSFLLPSPFFIHLIGFGDFVPAQGELIIVIKYFFSVVIITT